MNAHLTKVIIEAERLEKFYLQIGKNAAVSLNAKDYDALEQRGHIVPCPVDRGVGRLFQNTSSRHYGATGIPVRRRELVHDGRA